MYNISVVIVSICVTTLDMILYTDERQGIIFHRHTLVKKILIS